MKINKNRELPAFATLVTLLVLFLASAANAQVIKTTVTDIVSNPDQYDGKMVQVEGKVLALKFRISEKGNPYTTFKLGGNWKALKVFSFGTLLVRDGDSVKVIGRYQEVKHVGEYIFYDEIDATGGSVKKFK